MSSIQDIPFRCPRCAGPLQTQAEGFYCGTCGISYPIRDGIVDFRSRRHDYDFNPVPRAEMADLVRRAPYVPWDETVRRFLSFVRNVPDWVDNVVVNGRYSWKLFLELRPGSRFLDFGCGLGNLTQNIAPHVGEVVALDLTWERLQFAQQRFAKFNPDSRITLVAGGDGPRLPFPDAHFDCIALSGVLEWIPADASLHAGGTSSASKALKMLMTFFGETNPRKTQLRFLKELRRILKPDGQLFVAIENRWSYEYFKGRPDNHSGLKYASLLPRFLANVYSIARKRKPYRTYTYSFHEFGRLFAAAGFPHQECLGLTPGYTRLREIIPPHNGQTFWRGQARETWSARVKRSRYFVPAFGMAARGTAGPSTSLVGRLIGEIEKTRPDLGQVLLHTCVVTGKDKLVFKGTADGKSIILKIPASSQAQTGEANNWSMLERLWGLPNLAGLLPQPLAHGVHQGLTYFLERAVDGQPLRKSRDAPTRAAAARKVNEVLRRMHPADGPRVAVGEGSEAYTNLLTVPLAKLRAAGVDPAQCDRLEARLKDALAAQPWSLGLYHGDFSKSNVFVSGGELSGVIDWECATAQGLPVLDAICYTESMQRLADAQISDNMVRLAVWDWPSPDEVDLLRGLYEYFRIDAALHGALCELSWLQHMSEQLDTVARFNPQAIAKNVGRLLSADEPLERDEARARTDLARPAATSPVRSSDRHAPPAMMAIRYGARNRVPHLFFAARQKIDDTLSNFSRCRDLYNSCC